MTQQGNQAYGFPQQHLDLFVERVSAIRKKWCNNLPPKSQLIKVIDFSLVINYVILGQNVRGEYIKRCQTMH